LIGFPAVSSTAKIPLPVATSRFRAALGQLIVEPSFIDGKTQR
jgi:hypothetical protein